MVKDLGGRPTVMTDLVIQKLEDEFKKGHSDEEACNVANISMSTLYNYQNAHPEFVDRKKLLKTQPNYLTREIIYESLVAGDKDMAKWYAERKMKDEFSTKQETELNVNGEVALVKWK
jgi:hypothetical protein